MKEEKLMLSDTIEHHGVPGRWGRADAMGRGRIELDERKILSAA